MHSGSCSGRTRKQHDSPNNTFIHQKPRSIGGVGGAQSLKSQVGVACAVAAATSGWDCHWGQRLFWVSRSAPFILYWRHTIIWLICKVARRQGRRLHMLMYWCGRRRSLRAVSIHRNDGADAVNSVGEAGRCNKLYQYNGEIGPFFLHIRFWP